MRKLILIYSLPSLAKSIPVFVPTPVNVYLEETGYTCLSDDHWQNYYACSPCSYGTYKTEEGCTPCPPGKIAVIKLIAHGYVIIIHLGSLLSGLCK